MTLFSKGIKFYSGYLDTYPLVVKSITSGFMYGIGDIMAQGIESKQQNKDFKLDIKRLIIFTTFGTIIAGPMYHYWFNNLDRLPHLIKNMRIRNHERKFESFKKRAETIGVDIKNLKYPAHNITDLEKTSVITSKVLADQLIFSPIYLCIFFYSVDLMNGKTLNETKEHLRKSFGNVFMADCALWPMAQMINFSYIPTKFAPFYVNILNLFWNTFLSITAHQNH